MAMETNSSNLITDHLEKFQRVAVTCHYLKDFAITTISHLDAGVANMTSSCKMLKNKIDLSLSDFVLHAPDLGSDDIPTAHNKDLAIIYEECKHL